MKRRRLTNSRAREREQSLVLDYAELDDPFTLFPATIDKRRPPKERVLGIPLGSGGLAFPFGLLDEEGVAAAVSVDFDGRGGVVFWNRFKVRHRSKARLMS